MQNFNRFHLPFQYFRPYRNNIYYHIPPKVTNSFSSSNFNSPLKNMSNSLHNANSNENVCYEPNKEDKLTQNLPPNSDFVLDLFGLHLYFDDVLILGLLFFLYKENVKDEGLFLALVMLLIS